MRATVAMRPVERVTAGRMRCFQVPTPEVGRSLSWTEKMRMRTMARKNWGRDDAEDGAHGGGGVDYGAAAESGDDAEGEAEGDAEDEGGGAEAQAVGQAFEDDGGGGHAVAEGVAEVELEGALPEDGVLDDDVLVQPHFAADLLVFLFDLLGGAIGIEVDAEAGGIAGDADQEEDEGYDQEYDEDRLEEAADDEGAHW